MIKQYKKKSPNIATTCFVAENTSIIGDVQVQEHSSIWFHTVIRADSDEIRIGSYTNIQDNCTLHTDTGHKLIIKDRVTIGHNAIIHGACIEEECLVGMGAIVLNGAQIGKHSIIGAGTLIREHQIIPENSVVVGCPGKVVKQVTAEQIQDILNNALHYAQLGKEYQEE